MTEMVSARVSPFLPSDVLLLSESPPRSRPGGAWRFRRRGGCGGGLEEAARNHLVLQQLRLRIGLQFCRGFQNQFQLFAAEVVYGNDVFLIKRIHVYLLTPGKKSPSNEGSGNRFSNGKKNGRPASDFRRGKTICRTRLTMLPPGKLSGIIRSSLLGSSDLMHALLNANGSL